MGGWKSIASVATTVVGYTYGIYGMAAVAAYDKYGKDKLFPDGVPEGFDYEAFRRQQQVQESDAATEATFMRRQALNNNLL